MAKLAPREVPLINGEPAFIAAYAAEVAEANQRDATEHDASVRTGLP